MFYIDISRREVNAILFWKIKSDNFKQSYLKIFFLVLFFKSNSTGAGEMPQQLVALPEDSDLIPIIHMRTHNWP